MIVTSKSAVRSVEEWCREQSAQGEHQLGIEVEFKVITEMALRQAPASMFIYDLLAAHRLVYGSENFVRTLSPTLSDPSVIPRHEAARLLSTAGAACCFQPPRCEQEMTASETALWNATMPNYGWLSLMPFWQLTAATISLALNAIDGSVHRLWRFHRPGLN